MFTGIIQATAKILHHEEFGELIRLKVAKPSDWKLQDGQSIAINGVCLTVTEHDRNSFVVEMMPETINRTAFGSRIPESVNLEQSMGTTALFEGHIVQGHVDTIGTVSDIVPDENTAQVYVSYPKKFDELVIAKGSIALDGISLTIIEPEPGSFGVSLIPHTLKVTTLGELEIGDSVNLEFDIIGKYIAKQLRSRHV